MDKTLIRVIFTGLAFVAAPSMAQVDFPPWLGDGAKDAYRAQYPAAARHKAFAVTKDGQHFYFVYERKSPGLAARTASLQCLTAFRVPCLVWKVDDDELLVAYDKAAAESAKAIAALPAEFSDKAYGGERTDMGISAPTSLRDGTQVHTATPLTAPAGATAISTRELVSLYKSEPGLVVLDTLGDNEAKKNTLPKASWLNGSGWSQANKNKTIEANFSYAMNAIAPNKETPIVSYCLDYECWLSWNAAMRLVAMGYTRVYWYRGGIEAWSKARLPLVATPITAQLW